MTNASVPDHLNHLRINLIYDASALAAPQSFRDSIQTAANELEAAIYNDITVNIAVGYGEIKGIPITDGSSQGTQAAGIFVSYSDLRAQLAADETSATDITAVNSLPDAASVNGSTEVGVYTAQEKALGYLAGNDPGVDGYVGFATSFPTSDLVGAALHEITHSMGRYNDESLMALYRFSSPGVRVLDGSAPGSGTYFSLDGGATHLADFGVTGDTSDWLNPPASNLTPNDPFDQIGPSQPTLTAADLQMLDVLGYDVTQPQVPASISMVDTTDGQPIPVSPAAYSGPVGGLQYQYIYTGSDSVNITVTGDNWFLHGGPGEDALQTYGGYNVLDGGTGSNFLTGGSGTDTFFVDDRGPPSDVWSTVNNFHLGDDATVFGIVQSPAIQWFDNQGASGFTGLTLHVFGQNAPTASLTLAGYSSSDLGNGRLTVQFGSETDGTPFMHIIASG